MNRDLFAQSTEVTVNSSPLIMEGNKTIRIPKNTFDVWDDRKHDNFLEFMEDYEEKCHDVGIYSPKNLFKYMKRIFKPKSWYWTVFVEQVYPSYEKNDSFTYEHFKEVVKFMRLQIQPVHEKTTENYSVKFWAAKGKKLQRSREPVKSFYFRILKLQRKAGIPDSPKIKDFVNKVFEAGLYMREVRTTVRTEMRNHYPDICPIETLIEKATNTESFLKDIEKRR